MGKNDKVYLENGKVAQNPMQNYWNKQRSREMQKNKERGQKKFEQKNNTQDNKKPDTERDDNDFYSRQKIDELLAEKERRRQGQYNSKINLQSELKIASQDQTQKKINIPGFDANFINQIDIERNKKLIDRNKLQHIQKEQNALQRKKEKDDKLDFNEMKPEELNNMLQKRPNNNNNQQQQMKKKIQQRQESDPFFKLTQDEDYDPQKKIKLNQIIQNQQQPIIQAQIAVEQKIQIAKIEQPSIIQRQSTVKKSKIDLTIQKQLFVPPQIKKQILINHESVKKIESNDYREQADDEYEQFLKDIGRK